MPEYVLTHRDAVQYYRDCIVTVKGEPFLIERIEETITKGIFRYKGYTLGKKEWEPQFYDLREDMFSVDIPDLGFVNLPDLKYTAYFQRRAKRQWKKGYHQETIYPYALGEKELYYLGISPHPPTMSFGVVREVFKGKYPTWREVVSNILNGKYLSLAWSKDWALAISAHTVSPILYHRLSPVGRYSQKEKRFVLSPEAAVFRDSLLDSGVGITARLGNEA